MPLLCHIPLKVKRTPAPCKRSVFEGNDNAKSAWQMSPRLVKIRNLVFDRSVTLLNCIDLDKNQDRQFRLDRIQQASVLDAQV